MSIPAYLILGSPSSGRCGIAHGVISSALGDDDFCGVFISENETHTEFDKQIASSPISGFMRYSDAENAAEKISKLDENKFTQVFYIADSSRNLADSIEDFKKILDGGRIRLARIWSVFDCLMFEKFPRETAPWFDALSHFADCVLLSNRSGVPNKTVADIKTRYEKMCHPHLFVNVDKNFNVSNPMEILLEEARRISMFFDDVDPLDELDLDEDNLPEEPFSLELKPDPYLERNQNGARSREIPDVSEYAKKAHSGQL